MSGVHLSRFNYLSDFEKDEQRLLINFLSQSAEIIDTKSARFFYGEEDSISREEKKYLLERGYLFRNKDEESAIFNDRYMSELANKKRQLVVLVDTIGDNIALGKMSTMVQKLTASNEVQSVIFCNERSLYDFSSLDRIIKCFNSETVANLMTISDDLVLFERSLRKKQISALTLRISPESLGKSVPFEGDTERLLDWLIGHNITVEFIVELRKNHTVKLTRLMDYLIYKGWPFLGNFECTLTPECDEGCLFGHSYSCDDICRGVFHEYTAHPETEFVTMKRWIGINVIQSLIWTGRLPKPVFHFCEGIKGSTVFLANGKIFPCIKMARELHLDAEGFRNKGLSRRNYCEDCDYLLACGGGCIHNTTRRTSCPPVKDMIELATEFYFEEFLKRLAFNEKYVGKMK